MFIARGNDPPLADTMAVDPNTMVNNDANILGDPVIVVATDGTGAKLPPGMFASGTLHAPNTALHWRTTRRRCLLAFLDDFRWVYLHP